MTNREKYGLTIFILGATYSTTTEVVWFKLLTALTMFAGIYLFLRREA